MRAAFVLIDPKTPYNVGGVIRAASVLGGSEVWWTGSRVEDGRDTARGMGSKGKRWRLPREERMRAYNVQWGRDPGALEALIARGLTPVCVEIVPGAEPLPTFAHPEDAVYVLGPEDGDVPKGVRVLCHRFVRIPSTHCLNLAATANVVLYDRLAKEYAWEPGRASSAPEWALGPA